jgi:drug/metabolite transporter (DMT)-like permease
MTVSTGIALAFVAMLGWGFGDFLLQRSARKIGDWETLFVISLFGSIVLAPFSLQKMITFFATGIGLGQLVVLGCALVLFVAALFDLEALKEGKLSIVEPIWSLEIIFSAILAFAVLGERLGFSQIVLIILLILGLFLVALREKDHLKLKSFFVEKGVFLAASAAALMGTANFLMGWSARISDPISINFVVNVVLTVLCGLYLFFNGKLKKLFVDMKASPMLMVSMSISDTIAWVAFAFAMSLAPIGVAVALSESYIIIAVILGFFINHEKIQRHQKIGLIMAIITAVILAVITT